MVYDGAATVPMAHPFIWRKCLPLKLNLFSVNMWFIRVVITSVGGCFNTLLLRHSFKADIPSMCFMFEYEEWTSIVTKIALCGILFICFILFMRSVVSRT